MRSLSIALVCLSLVGCAAAKDDAKCRSTEPLRESQRMSSAELRLTLLIHLLSSLAAERRPGSSSK